MSGALGTPENTNTSVRSRASPRTTPSESVSSSPSSTVSPKHSGSKVLWRSEQSLLRGRTLTRNPAINRYNSCATIDVPPSDRWPGYDNVSVYPRLTSRDLTAEPEDMFNAMLEPLPLGVERFRSSLSEELYKAATWHSSIDLTRFGDHRDTFAVLGMRKLRDRCLTLPSAFWQGLLPYIDYGTYSAIRLSCRCWSIAITHAPASKLPSVPALPAEILEKIYTRLDPVDFNSARHTCRAWMISSLDKRLLTDMLKRGGWWAAARADVVLQEREGRMSPNSVSEEWSLSRRFASECSLRPDWTGNGTSRDLSLSRDGQFTSTTSLVLASETDFSELSNGYNPTDCAQNVTAVHFTVSFCNNFILVTEGCVIYVYSLRDESAASYTIGGHLSPLTTIICPHRILAVCMDTSSNRFAVATLLEGRVGLVYDLHRKTAPSSGQLSPRALSTNWRDSRPSAYSSRSSGEDIVTEAISPRTYANAPHEYMHRRVTSPGHRATGRPIAKATLPEIHGSCPILETWTMDDPAPNTVSQVSDGLLTTPSVGHIPLESDPRSIYRNLCSVEDPPRSVAICLQRRCVAFGCKGGIELHWIDVLTGQDLNRWFPLTEPSDFLYFLPSRPRVDSAEKLRLISSACHPKEKGPQARFLPGNSEARHHGMSWDEELGDSGGLDYTWRGSAFCDHYQAVPVSDGWNILFTDPEEGHLCLGTHAPPGAGATKLVRRYIFLGPTDPEGRAIVPRVYKSGGELRWGLRAVVGYGDAVWLFVVPPDSFLDDDQKGRADEWHSPNRHDDIGPTRIEGVEFGRIPGLVDIAVDATGGNLTIWAFAVEGMAYVWQIAGGPKPLTRRIILRDGTLINADDLDGDTFMHGISSPRTQPAHQFHWPTSLRLLPSHLEYSKNDHIIDEDGDIRMPDVPFGPQDEGYSSADDEFQHAGGIFAIHAQPLGGSWSDESADWVPDYLREHGDGVDDEGLGADVLERTRVEVVVLGG